MRLKDEEWDQVLNVNMTSSMILCRAAIRAMMKARWGRIISISSIVGVTGNPGQTNYAASKAGMIGFSKSLAQEVASRGITVNVVAPGFIQTQMTDVLTDEQKDKLLVNVPCGRLGQPEDIASAVGAIWLVMKQAISQGPPCMLMVVWRCYSQPMASAQTQKCGFSKSRYRQSGIC